ncbi:MAG: hypothetical protein AAB262_13720 [Elusimicrobiota bacterium]
MKSAARSDVVILVADVCMEATVRGLLSRWKSLGIRQVQFDLYRHPEKDPGCRTHGADFLAPLRAKYEHALLMFDHEGCGDCATSAIGHEAVLGTALARSWGDRAAALVIEPELDIWVWSRSPHVESVLGWSGRRPALRDWLVQKEFLVNATAKPSRPKEALEAALRHVKKPRSSAIYQALAEKVSLQECVDPSFARFRAILKKWCGVNDER